MYIHKNINFKIFHCSIFSNISYSIHRAKMIGGDIFELATILAFLVGFLIFVAKVLIISFFFFIFPHICCKDQIRSYFLPRLSLLIFVAKVKFLYIFAKVKFLYICCQGQVCTESCCCKSWRHRLQPYSGTLSCCFR